MAYASQTQIQHAAGGADRLVELADYDGDGIADADVIAAVQAAADGWIDSYAALRYAVPIEDPTDTLVQLAAEECVYRLRQRRALGATEQDERQHKDREQWLVHLSKGLVRPSNPAPAKSDAVRSEAVVNNRDVSRRNLEGYR